jgi:hypothetical protein
MTARVRDGLEPAPTIDWAAVELEYGWRAALHAIDVVMARHRDRGLSFDWPDTKADALALLEGREVFGDIAAEVRVQQLEREAQS